MEKTSEQVAAEAVAAQKKADKAAAKAAAKVTRDEAKAAKVAAKAQAKADKIAAKQSALDAKLAAKALAAEAKKADRMPEQNGIRRPKAGTLCGKAWGVFDSLSAERGSAAAIGDCLVHTRTLNLNDGNVRSEYARWRKFNGVSGRVSSETQATPSA